MKVAVIGANGQLGSEICKYFSDKCEIIPLTHDDIEIIDMDNVYKVLDGIKPQVVINTAAYHNVPQCEQNPVLSFQVNGQGALNLAKISNDLNYKIVHYSTDYVFDGEKKAPYIEDDRTNPLNIYGLTKLDGENIIKNYCDKYFIIRTTGLYGKTLCRAKRGNFITTMIKAAKTKPVVKVVNDEILTPSSAAQVALNTYELVNTESYGLYHMTCQGYCSWYEFACVIFEKLNLQTPLEPCSVSDFPVNVKRPTYSVLENQNLKSINLDNIISWEDALIEHLNEIK